MRCVKCEKNIIMQFPGGVGACCFKKPKTEKLTEAPKKTEYTKDVRLAAHKKNFESKHSAFKCSEIRRINKEGIMNCEEIAKQIGIPYHAVYTYIKCFPDSIIKRSGGSNKTTRGRFRNHLILKDEITKRLLEGKSAMKIVKECGLDTRSKVDSIRCAMVKKGLIKPAKIGRKFKGEYEALTS